MLFSFYDNWWLNGAQFFKCKKSLGVKKAHHDEKLWRFTQFKKKEEMIKQRKGETELAISYQQSILLVNLWTDLGVVEEFGSRIHGDEIRALQKEWREVKA